MLTQKKNETCPFKDLVQEWDEDDGDIIALICEGCVYRDECSEDEYNKMEMKK